jgi:hypothetical protein
MPMFLRIRWIAFRLVRALRRAILQEDSAWEFDADSQGGAVLMAKPYRVVVVPRAFRVCDAVHLYCDETEVWLPILARIRLRSAVRLYLLQHALSSLPDGESKPRKPSRTRA